MYLTIFTPRKSAVISSPKNTNDHAVTDINEQHTRTVTRCLIPGFFMKVKAIMMMGKKPP